MLVSDVLLLIRYATGDMSDAKFSVYDKLMAFNAGNRFLRKMAMDYKPSLLNTSESQNTVASTGEYTLTSVPSKILSVRVGGDIIDKIAPEDIDDLTETGEPQGYYQSAYNKISFWPVPDNIYAFTVYMNAASSDLAETDTVPWSSDLADVVASYAAGLLTGSLDRAALKIEARRLLSGIEPESVGVKSYWTIPIRSDY